MDVAFALGVSLRYVDYLIEEDLKSYGLAPVKEEDVNPLRASLGPTIMRSPAVKVASSMLPIEAPRSSIVVSL